MITHKHFVKKWHFLKHSVLCDLVLCWLFGIPSKIFNDTKRCTVSATAELLIIFTITFLSHVSYFSWFLAQIWLESVCNISTSLTAHAKNQIYEPVIIVGTRCTVQSIETTKNNEDWHQWRRIISGPSSHWPRHENKKNYWLTTSIKHISK